MSSKYLSRDEILTAEDIETEEVFVSEWATKNNPKGAVLVRGLNAQERDNFQISILEQPGKSVKVNMTNATSKLAALCIVDENGDRVFSQKDVLELGQKSGSALNKIYTVAQRLSGLSKGDLEELTVNLTQGQSENSNSN